MKQTKPLAEIISRLHEVEIPDNIELIVAIADGGLIPAALVKQRLQVPLEVIKISFRDDNHQPMFDKPRIISTPQNIDGKNILLVDDVCRSGSTFTLAKKALVEAKHITTLVVNGKADIALFNEECFYFPWLI